MVLAAGQTGHLADHQEGVYVVVHGATAGTARPTLGSASTAPTCVLWEGTVEPTNAVNGDVWWDETNSLLKVKVSGSFVASGSAAYEPKQLIAETVLGSAAATISFTSIPATFRHLELVLEGRTAHVGTSIAVGCQFNADGGTNYDRQTLQAVGTAVSATQTAAGSYIQLGILSGTTAATDSPGSIRAMFPSYRQTTWHKTVIAECAAQASSLATQRNVGRWANTAAITRIDLFNTSSANFLAGTVATLYGRQDA